MNVNADCGSSGRAALVIINWEYRDLDDLKHAREEGELMKSIFENSKFKKDQIVVIENSKNILGYM